jgi:hypothetical protein
MIRSQLCATATAITAVGFLTVAMPAQAAPEACSQYAFNGDYVISGANTGQVIVSDVLPGTRFAGKPSPKVTRPCGSWVRPGR